MSNFLPDEVETEILLRVPVKSLLRFRQVCKRWHSLISSSFFIKKHLSPSSFSPSKTLVIFYSKTHSKNIYRVFHDDTFNVENSTDISYSFNLKWIYFHVVGYINGLMCLSDHYMFGKAMILWNPSIKRALTLPNPMVRQSSYYALGFVYDAKNDDYKVVKVSYKFCSRGDNNNLIFPSGVEVFSLSSGKWACVKLRFENNFKSFLSVEHISPAAVYDGILHWHGCKVVRKENMYYQNSMVTFDLNSDTFGELGLPSELLAVARQHIIQAIVIRGLFSVLDFDYWFPTNYDNRCESSPSCAIWVMNDYGNIGSWVKRYTVKLDGGVRQVLGMKRGGDIVCSSSGESAELITYNCENMTTTTTGIFGDRGSFFVNDYVESLVLLGKGREVSGKEIEETPAKRSCR